MICGALMVFDAKHRDASMELWTSLETLHALASVLAKMLVVGDAVLLEGEAGTGKTEFARSLLRAACDDAYMDVPSPSFSLLQQYDGALGQITHLDLYRLSGEGDLLELGWEELREGIVLVEWPDRLGKFEPTNALRIRLEAGAVPDVRRICVSGWRGKRLDQLIWRFAAR